MGCNGYGGSYTTAIGEAAAQLDLTDTAPESTPEDVFSPKRLLEGAPLFLAGHEEPWAIARSLSRRLRRLMGRAADAYSQSITEVTPAEVPVTKPPPAAPESTGSIGAECLAGLP